MENTEKKTFYLIAPILAIISLIIKTFVGLNGDEEWMFSFIKCFSQDKNFLLRKSWDIWQITGTINNLFAKILDILPFAKDYQLLLFRILAILLVIICSIRLYYFLVNDLSISKYKAIFFSSFLLLSAPKGTYNLENSTGLMIFYFLFSIEMYEYLKKEKISSLVISAISLTIAVLYYPTIAIVYIVVSLYLLFKKKDLKTKWIFILIPLLIACVFLMYYLSDWEFISNQLIYSIKQTIAGNDTHKISNITKIFSDIKRCAIFSIAFAIPTIIIDKTILKNTRINLAEYSYIFSSISIILLIACLLLRIGGSILSGTYVYIIVVSILANRNKKVSIICKLYFLLLIVTYCSSDQNLDYNCRYLLPALIILLAIEMQMSHNKIEKIFNLSFSALLFVSLVFSIAIYISYDHGQSGLIFDKHESITTSPYKGVYMENTKAEYYNCLPEISIHNEYLTIIGEDVRVGAYSMYDCNPLTVNMSSKYYSYGERWISFYKFVNVEKCYIMLDKEFSATMDDFSKKDSFGEYLLNNYKIFIESENDRFIVYKITMI